jgi:type I restriction enzyme M protein
MAVKKSELYSSLWQSCDELRGGMDASEYKDYVLVLLFVKYVSDKYAGRKHAAITVPKGASFADMVALKGTKNIGEDINKKILGPLEKINELSFGGVDFDDSNKLGDGKEKVDRLTNLIAIFENKALDFSKNRADGDDLLGDAYEYLMRHFATESGKSKGQFYTPSEVSRTIAQLLGIRHAATSNSTTIYDPACGSGSLLLKVGEEAAHGANASVKVTLCGQEKDSTTAGLARMNMILHDFGTAKIEQGNTLAKPLFTDGESLKTFDYVVANPPFSDKRWSTGLHPDEGGAPVTTPGTQTARNYGRFTGFGIPPAKQGDYAYLLHILRSLKTTGRAACILPHGVLFRGNAEAVIRQNLVTKGYLRAIIGLPANLFYGTGIPACILILDKADAPARKGIFMIDASQGFRKDGNKNRLREQDIHKIVDTYTRRQQIPGYSRLVPTSEIADPKNAYNLNLPRYIDGNQREDLQDITAHLHGGIPDRDLDAPDLAAYWKVLPSVRAALFRPLRPGYSELTAPSSQLKASIFGHPEFTAFNQTATKLFAKWRRAHLPTLLAIDKTTRPKSLIETLAEDLLATFEKAPLLDPYDVYQHLMDYWAETLQDDVYLVAADGWRAATQPRLIVEDKKVKTKTRPDLVVGRKKYQIELIPPTLVIARYFAAEQAEINRLEAEVAALQQQIEEHLEEHGGEDGPFADLEKITRATVTSALSELGRAGPLGPPSESAVAEDQAPYGKSTDTPPTDAEILRTWLNLSSRETEQNRRLGEAQDALAVAVLARYGTLTEDEIKTLAVEDKWLATLAASVQGELDRVSQTLTGRLRQLTDRYATPLPQLIENVDTLAARVDAHLKKMAAAAK